MGDDNMVLIQIRGDVADINAKLADLKGQFGKVKDEMKTSSDSIKNSWQLMAAGISSVLNIVRDINQAFSGLKNAILSVANAYAQSETAEIQLTAVLKAHGVAGKDVVDAYKNIASELQAQTGIQDEAVLSAMKYLTIMGVGPAKIREATEATIMLTSAGYDMDTAAKAVAQAMEGQFKQLGKIIPALKNAEKGYVDKNKVLQLIRENIGPVAQAEAETYAGKIKRLDSSWDDLKETLGGAVVPALKSLIDTTREAIHELQQLFGINDIGWKQKELQLIEEKIKRAKDAMSNPSESPDTDSASTLKYYEARRDALKKEIEEEKKQNKNTLDDADKDYKKTKLPPKGLDEWKMEKERLTQEIETSAKYKWDRASADDEWTRTIDTPGLDEISVKIGEIVAKAEKMRIKFKDIGESRVFIDKWEEGQLLNLEIEQGTKLTEEQEAVRKKALEDAKKLYEGGQANADYQRSRDVLKNDQALNEAKRQRSNYAITDRQMNEAEIASQQRLLDIETQRLEKMDPAEDQAAYQNKLKEIEEIKEKLKELQNTDASINGKVKTSLLGWADTASDAGARMGDVLKNALDNASSALTDFVMTGKADAKALLDSIARDFVNMMIKINVTAPLAKSMSGLNWGSLFGSAQGNVFEDGEVRPVRRYRLGGIIDRPSWFPMANGAGLMGEAGPEAVMPLTRLPNGNLGVQAAGGVSRLPDVEVRIYNDDSSNPKQISKVVPSLDMTKYVLEVWLDAVNRNRMGVRDTITGLK